MSNHHLPITEIKSVSEAIARLHSMRDALLRVSGELRDLQFDADEIQRSCAAERANELVNRLKS